MTITIRSSPSSSSPSPSSSPSQSSPVTIMKLIAVVLTTILIVGQCANLSLADNNNNNKAGSKHDLDIDSTSLVDFERGLSSFWSSQSSQSQSSSSSSSPTTALIKRGSQQRGLGMLALKAIILGPLIGLTIKAALVRGIIWAVLAYGLHLFFPALLSSLGLGTGLVGFARQIRPDYSQLFAAYFLNLIQTLPSQYNHIISPIIESIKAIPEGHCRYRAVCETASHLIRNVRSMSSSLQRISATVYMNFGTDYSKAWLDGIVQSDCAIKYQQCTTSPFSMIAAKLAQTIK